MLLLFKRFNQSILFFIGKKFLRSDRKTDENETGGNDGKYDLFITLFFTLIYNLISYKNL